MNRKTIVVPGYDCIAHPCGKNGCGVRPGHSHGRHGDDWMFVVHDGDCALSLTISSGKYPGDLPPREPHGSDVSLHCAFPIRREHVAGVEDDSRDCELVPGGKCYQGSAFSSALQAQTFFEHHFAVAGGLQQEDGFWTALENWCARWAAEARARRVDLTWQRCPCCSGAGVVARTEAS